MLFRRLFFFFRITALCGGLRKSIVIAWQLACTNPILAFQCDCHSLHNALSWHHVFLHHFYPWNQVSWIEMVERSII